MIPFTQYLRPDGRKTEVSIDRPEEIEKLARVFIDAGGYFECEHLRTGHASFTAGYKDEDIAIQLCPNGPEVDKAVDRLVQRAYNWLRENGDVTDH